MSDPGNKAADYLSAYRHLNEAEQKLDKTSVTVGAVAEWLKGYKNSGRGSGVSKHSGSHPELANWPKADEIEKTVETYLTVRVQLNGLWNSLREDERTGLREPPPV